MLWKEKKISFTISDFRNFRGKTEWFSGVHGHSPNKQFFSLDFALQVAAA
jgi:hypothetical protein